MPSHEENICLIMVFYHGLSHLKRDIHFQSVFITSVPFNFVVNTVVTNNTVLCLLRNLLEQSLLIQYFRPKNIKVNGVLLWVKDRRVVESLTIKMSIFHGKLVAKSIVKQIRTVYMCTVLFTHKRELYFHTYPMGRRREWRVELTLIQDTK